MKKRERAMFVYTIQATIKNRKKKSKKKLGLKFLSPVIVPKLRSESRV
jgi:hypothetical protein